MDSGGGVGMVNVRTDGAQNGIEADDPRVLEVAARLGDTTHRGKSPASDLLHGKPPGHFLWAVFFVIAAGYYLWTKFAAGGGTRLTGKRNGSIDERIRFARMQQQEKLSAEMAQKKTDAAQSKTKKKLPEKVVVDDGNTGLESSSAPRRGVLTGTAAKAEREKRRKLYLRRKKEEEEEEEKRRKIEELGPGWQRHEGGGAMGYNAMDPNASSSGGGYRPARKCVRRGG